MNDSKTFIGIQGGVMGWDDPFNPELCKQFMRTGERKYFPSQDPNPSVDEEMAFVKKLGADFYLHHAMSDNNAILEFTKKMEEISLDYMIGNEYGAINEDCVKGTNRSDIPVELIEGKDKLMGLIYDETEHLQLHPDIYFGNSKILNKEDRTVQFQWADPTGLTLQQIEDNVVDSVKEVVNKYGGTPLFGEYVFPVMQHTLARGGMNPCPKILKEEFASIQLSTALGAAKQYKRKLGICVDLWGQDVGAWFTRLWGFPGHSPVEFFSALKLAYLISPDNMFVENIDVLARYTGKEFIKSEFGEIFEEFVKSFIPSVQRNYHHSDFEPDVVIIRSDDTVWRDTGGFGGRGAYGSFEIMPDQSKTSSFEVFNLLSNGATPVNGLTTFLPQFDFPHGKYERNSETVKNLPLMNGVPPNEESSIHKLYYPLKNVAVLDEQAVIDDICNPKLIIVAGSRLTSKCLKSVLRAVDNGAKCVIASWLIDEFNIKKSPNILYTSCFLSDSVKEFCKNYISSGNDWNMRFSESQLNIYNCSDGVELNFEILKR